MKKNKATKKIEKFVDELVQDFDENKQDELEVKTSISKKETFVQIKITNKKDEKKLTF